MEATCRYVVLFLLFLNHHVDKGFGRIHLLSINDDIRSNIVLTTFGFLQDGYLDVCLEGLEIIPQSEEALTSQNAFGFTLEKTVSPAISSHYGGKEECVFNDVNNAKDDSIDIVYLHVDPLRKEITVQRRGADLRSLTVISVKDDKDERRRRRSIVSDSFLLARRATEPELKAVAALKSEVPIEKQSSNPSTKLNASVDIPSADKDSHMTVISTNQSIPIAVDKDGKISTHFRVVIKEHREEGLYSLIFHNCHNQASTAVRFVVYLTEKNVDNYLSAGDMPLPLLFFVSSVIHFVIGCYWLCMLRSSSEGVFKLHYLMLTLVWVKCMSLLFHGVNYYFIQKEGRHEEAFAILYYITHLMKGALLFITIVLIGAGWAFIKHILSDREKKIFIIVIPLQILANVAQIILEETEEGQSDYETWREIFILVDLVCCGAILFPVVWSMRHLQEASQTDGKAAINLRKLKLFRHFYIMIVCYIYFTRIIIYLLRITVPFRYDWLNVVFRELATLIFFLLTGFKFRPASDNPYLQVPSDSEDEIEMDEVVTEVAAYENITKVNVRSDSTKAEKRESSHDYD